MTTDQAGPPTNSPGLYTPEAVRIDLPLADLGSRILAKLIDLFVMAIMAYFIVILVLVGAGLSGPVGRDGPGWVFAALLVGLLFLVFWGYPVGLETLLGGRTAGKAALGLRVVTVEGAPIRFRHAAIRGIFGLIDFYLFFGIPGLITSLISAKGQRLGDLSAGTVTIRDRALTKSSAQAVPFVIPTALQSYADTIDVSGLRQADYALVRRFLLRSGTTDPRHRRRVAVDLANVMSERIGHRPPTGTHPEALLLCVAALMQQQGQPGAQVVRPPTQAPPPPPAQRDGSGSSDQWQSPPPPSWGPPVPRRLGTPVPRPDDGFSAPS